MYNEIERIGWNKGLQYIYSKEGFERYYKTTDGNCIRKSDTNWGKGAVTTSYFRKDGTSVHTLKAPTNKSLKGKMLIKFYDGKRTKIILDAIRDAGNVVINRFDHQALNQVKDLPNTAQKLLKDVLKHVK